MNSNPPRIAATHRKLTTARILTTALLVSAALSGCATTTHGGTVGADRQQLLLVSSAQMEQMAAQSYSKLTSEAASNHALNTDPVLTLRVQKIAADIEPRTSYSAATRWAGSGKSMSSAPTS